MLLFSVAAHRWHGGDMKAERGPELPFQYPTQATLSSVTQQHLCWEYLSGHPNKAAQIGDVWECAMTQLLNRDCFMVLVKLSVLGNAF